MNDRQPRNRGADSTLPQRAIRLRIEHPSAHEAPIQGFRFFWAFYVSGFRPDRHCQPCFRGRRVESFCTTTVRNGVEVVLDRMDRYPYVYVCGVGSGPRRELKLKNVHMPLRHREGGTVRLRTYNDYEVIAEDAELLEIPELPEGWGGRDIETTRCKNFRFGVHYFAKELLASAAPATTG